MQISFMLLKDLINSELPLLAVKNLTSAVKKNSFVVLNLLELNAAIKQFVRLLNLFSKKENSVLCFWVENTYLESLVKNLLTSLNLSEIEWRVQTAQPVFKKTKAETTFLIVLGQPPLLSAKFFESKLILNNIFLVLKINTTSEINFGGAYKLFGEIDTLQKILFLIILIKQTLKN
jgi:hypothetical protein